MSAEIEAVIRRTSADFREFCWPIVREWVGGGDLVPVETVTANTFAAELDRTAGIDMWVIQRGRHVFGLASRVQYARGFERGDPFMPYNTFAIRSGLAGSNGRTEIHKRREQVATPGSVYPRYTTQAYIWPHPKPRLVSVALAETAHILTAIAEGLALPEARNRDDGNRFLPVPWGRMQHRKIPIHVHDLSTPSEPLPYEWDN